MHGDIFLENEKVELRTVEEEDIDFLTKNINDEKVRIFQGNSKPKNLEQQKEFFENVISNDESVSLLICQDGVSRGIISLFPKEDRETAEIGLWIDPEHHGEGLGTEASKMMTQYGLQQLRYHKIFARADDRNEASKRVWEKIGFEQEGLFSEHKFVDGEYRDVAYFGITSDEFN